MIIIYDEECLKLLIRGGVEENPGPGNEDVATGSPNSDLPKSPLTFASGVEAAFVAGRQGRVGKKSKARRGRPKSAESVGKPDTDKIDDAGEILACECGKTFSTSRKLKKHKLCIKREKL